MEMVVRPFNNIPIYKKPVHYPDIIKLSHIYSLIDRLQFSLHNHYAKTVLDQFHSLFEYIGPIKVKKRFIHRFRHNHSLIDFVKWNRNSFNDYAVIVHDPDIELQNKLSQVIEVCPMNLSQVEVALDFYPDDKPIYMIFWRVMNDGLVLKYSRVGCYSKFKETEPSHRERWQCEKRFQRHPGIQETERWKIFSEDRAAIQQAIYQTEVHILAG